MLPAEGLNDILEEPAIEWGDEPNSEVDDDDDDHLEEELDLKINMNLIPRTASSRPDTTGDNKSLQSKNSRQPIVGFNANSLQRDATIESIIESRKSGVIENVYTRLAQTTSKSSHNLQINSLKPQINNQVYFSVLNERKLSLASAFQFQHDQWDDGLNADFDEENIPSIDKSAVQVYEDKCKHLNICPCSVIIRSLHTTKINLGNYGLGTKGSAALAAAMIRNITVLSLNLSGNNIGSNGMSYIYQILTENTYIEEYVRQFLTRNARVYPKVKAQKERDLSNNNLGTKGIRKLAAGAASCTQLRILNVAGNELSGNDIDILLSKIEDHRNLKDLNISHNQLDEDGGIYVAKWLSENNTLLNLDVSWCSIRLLGARAIAKSIGDNNKLLSLNLSHNSFTNDTIEFLTNSLTHNLTLKNLNLSGNEIFCPYENKIKDDPSILIIGKEAIVYKMFVIAATNQGLKIFRLGKNHIDARCIMIMLESLSKLDNISLEELDLTGLTLNSKQIADIYKFFVNHSKFTCYVGPIRETVEVFANNLLSLIHKYCQVNQMNLTELFDSNSESNTSNLIITYSQFRNGLKKAKIPFPAGQFQNIIKYLGRDDDEGTISLKSLEVI